MNCPCPPTVRDRAHPGAPPPERARTDRADLYDVLDAGMICHFAVVRDGSPVVLPTAYGRVGDTLYLHGSSANRTLLAADGQQVSVAVTHLDGLVCARAAFSHSVNYRSAVVFGVATLVRDDAERLAALAAGHPAADPRPLGGAAQAHPQGARRHRGAGPAAHGGVGQDPHRPPADDRTTSAPGCGRAWFPSR
jgi:nitroimidazol reductase NimA-like FMN-containing flavoprotein (pyridoxamine 5'-phosphate oxidase superfamily)